MADSMPVCDVLFEASEYLTKLGTNIRTRSENLREKRIRKDKLRNTHAIHKAVHKVLQICELSKKSIENVETGVKNFLRQMENAGATFGPGPETCETSESGVKFEHFTYESRTLKIRDRISVVHYTSVKVMSTSMPLSMIEKYPVYYDCKLYRLRNREEEREPNDSISKCGSPAIQNSDEIEKSCLEGAIVTKGKSSNETDHEKIEVIDKMEMIHNKKEETQIDNIGHKKDNEQITSDGPSNDLVPRNEVKESNSCDDIMHCPDQSKDESDVEPKPKKRKYNKKVKKFRHIRVIGSSSSSDNEKTDTVSPCDINQKIDSDTIESCVKTEKNQGDTKTSHTTTETIKPLIKCVNLNKLLKPDRVKDLETENTAECKKSKDNSKLERKERHSKSELRNKARFNSKKLQNLKSSDESDDDEAYWSSKKKEITNFKPKEFTINVSRLPKITHGFLEKYCLRKITQMGSVICEVANDTGKEKSHSKENICKIQDPGQNLDIRKVKNALLYDSDSDNFEETCQNKEIQEKTKSDEPVSNNSDSEMLKNINEGQVSEVDDESQNEKACNSYCRATNINSKDSEVNVQEHPASDNINLQTKQSAIYNLLEGIPNTENETKDGNDQNVDANNKLKHKVDKAVTVREIEVSSKNNENILHIDPDSNMIGEQKKDNNDSEYQVENGQEKQENSKSVTEADRNLNVMRVKHKMKKKSQNLDCVELDLKQNNAEEVKNTVVQESDSDSQNEEKRVETSDKRKKSLPNESDLELNNEIQHVTNKVKNALLEDSDCESLNFNISTQYESEKIPDKSNTMDQEKKSLLYESDCDIVNQEIINANFNKGIDSHSLHESTDMQHNLPICKLSKKRSSSSRDAETVKSSLLKDSSDDVSKTPKKLKTYSGDSPPQTKRKHIMESMYAKKMLLTYSSSSDTEDEQLRNTLKEIKDYLLKGMSSDEDGNKDTNDSSEKDDENVARSVSKNNSSESDSEKEVEKLNSVKREPDSDSKDSSRKDRRCGNTTDNSSKSKMGRSSATPDGSCSQNSDTQDTHDREIDGLTNLKSLKKTCRRRKSENDKSSRSRRRRRMAKASGLISNEGFLEAESSSDSASLAGSDHADNVDLEDMPRVNISDINGDGIGHLAKDDLLGESDTSVSHDEKKSYKKEDDTDEDNVKSKRRKPIAISSDSEAGSSRRKDNNMRLSDFEDSEDESSEPVKNKRKKKVTESDASGGSSDDGKKKRRRIKTLDESEVSGSDTENEGRNKHGRKNIRKVMGKNQLEEATKKAAREEKERIARITERQKLYNNLEFDESGKPDEVVLEKVVLDFDPETKEPLIQVDRGLVKKLKPHQANGIKFMWDACFESVKRIKKDKGSGCILAHCMGLGKTLQVVSLTHTLLTHGTLTGVSRVLVVCPLSTVLNWVNEFRMWLKHAEADFEVDVYELSKFKQNSERAFQLSQWFEHGGVCVLGYEMFRNLSADKGKKFKKKILKNFQESLVDPGPDLVVCDEGHLLKNEKTSLSQSMNRVKTRRRIVLTGTPLQNNLKEYYCMVQFVKPNLLGKYNEYLNRFVNPITNGQYTDSTEHDIRVMKRRSHVLHKMLDGAVQRRDYGVLAPFLPPKHEYVLFITLTDVQIKLYNHYLDNYSRRPQPGKSSGFLFPDFQSLQRIWTHPLVLKYNSERYEIMQQKKREREEEDSEGSLVDFIDDDSTPDESSTEESSEDLSDLSDDSRKKSKKKKSAKKGKGKDSKASARRGTRANPIELDDDEPIEQLEVKSENPTEWWMKLVSEEELEDMRNSHKLVLLFDILRQCEAIGDKLLVFSQSLYSLDLIEHFLGKVDEATQAGRVDEKLGGHVGSWSPGVDYFRLDGSTSCENRSIWCKNFNRIDNQRARLFLISTRAGGLGINLVAANRVVIFDVSWNPSHDVQSIFRVYRFGQKKPCYVYRFLAMGTMEEKIYERQVTKQAISKRVIDEQQIDRHYAENDLAELYKFEPQPPVPRPLPPLPKDRLFAEMLKEHEAQIYKYHEHDSLLENKEEETLSEEERRAAWEDFENEKTRPPPQPFLSPYAMHNGMVQGLLAQQQQMAMATISAMLRKDMPNMSDQQLRETVPLILASNPGLMQKMSEIYKYAQPGMMNPAMMNPMNAGSMSGGSGMGASALHYEPPWQRQQQQQQQMRLQQLMQHQNTMGAKYYAGGLGSRDPMAMALQQQRARELMHRPRARGRPPLASAAPRPPPAHAGSNNAGDVVNLDSD